MSAIQYLLGGGCGALAGFALGAVGGGGSILATPLMIYVAGVTDPHLAIGTSALSVAASSGANLLNHARSGRVRWAHAGVFSLAGLIGAFGGSTLGKALNGQRLLALFALLMLGVALTMWRRRAAIGGGCAAPMCWNQARRLAGAGVSAGSLAGFFGIGGGFLIVPALIWATGMPMLEAVSSSLVAVTAFGLTTAVNYALDGWVLWPLAAAFLVGGVLGGIAGAKVAVGLAGRRNMLAVAFSGLLVAVALYILHRSL